MPATSSTATTGTRVLLDYKSPVESPTLSAELSRSTSEITNQGNGRIRKGLIGGGITVIGLLIFKVLLPPSTAETTQLQEPTAQLSNQPNTPATSITALPALHVSAPLTQKTKSPPESHNTPEFIFNQPSSANIAQASTSVPFVEVENFNDHGTNNIEPTSQSAFQQASSHASMTTQSPTEMNEPSHLAVSVKKGDTLSGLLSKHGLTNPEIAQLTSLPEVSRYLVNIRPGQEFQVQLGSDRKLETLTRQLDLTRTLHVTRTQSGERFLSELAEIPLEKSIQGTILTLDTSLYVDGNKAGLTDSLIMELYSIFQWTVDFNREVRSGDSLLILHEVYFKDGEKVKDGNIVAAKYLSKQKEHEAFRHVANGKTSYYSTTGDSLTQRFLRNPIKARITSRFNLQRKHPILHTIRAHRGVDYGAPTGTPVNSAGDGRITFIGTRRGFGNTVEIKHGERYSTLYAHLSKFPKDLQAGSRVEQGQVIGYVGKSGLATGPHLHYEFRVDNVHRDPQTVKLPGAASLTQEQMAEFQDAIAPLTNRLASMLATTEDTLAMR